MAKKRLTEGEYAAATGLSGDEAGELYRKMREWRRAKTQADLKRGLYLTQSAFAAMGGRPIRAYKRDYMTPEQVQAMQASLLGQINDITEGRRKSAEDYRRALLQSATTVYAQRAGASREAAQRAGRLLEIRYKALFPEHVGIGGGSRSPGRGTDDPKQKYATAPATLKRLEAGQNLSSSMKHDVKTGGWTLTYADAGPGAGGFEDELSALHSNQQRPDEFGRDVDGFSAFAAGLFGDRGVDPETQRGLAFAALLQNVTGLTPTEVNEGYLTADGELDWGKLRGTTRRARDLTALQTLEANLDKAAANEDSGGGGGGGGYATIPGIDQDQFKALEDIAEESLGKVGVGGGGDFSALLQKIVTAAPGELPGLEAQIKESIDLPVSQGEAEPGRTPTGEGTLPPGASGEAPDGDPTSGTNPGDKVTQKIQNVRDPDAGLDQLWEMYERLDNAQTTERDLHLMSQIQASPQFKAMQEKLGISDPKAAIKAAKMLTRQRRRDERFRDVQKLRQIRKDTNRSALMGGLANRQRETMPPTVDKGSSGAAVMGGAGGFDAPDEKEREV